MGGGGSGLGGTTAAPTAGVLVGVAGTANMLTENISMQATSARMMVFFIGLSSQQSGAACSRGTFFALMIEGQTKLESLRGSTTGDVEPATDRSFLS